MTELSDTAIMTVCDVGHRVRTNLTAAALATYIATGHLDVEELNPEGNVYSRCCCLALARTSILIARILCDTRQAGGGGYVVIGSEQGPYNVGHALEQQDVFGGPNLGTGAKQNGTNSS